MGLTDADLVAMSRSAAMGQRGQRLTVDRDQLIAVCEELLECRRLLARLGSDLRTVATHSRRAAGQ